MIRPLEEKDIDTVCSIVNENWKNVYSGYVNPLLLNSDGCAARTRRLKTDFAEQKAKEQGYKEIVIWAFKNNHHVVSFYKKRGYSIDKEEYLSEPYFSMGIRLKKYRIEPDT